LIGKHSGRASIVNKLNEYDIHVTPEIAGKILEAVRATSIRLKRSLMDKEIIHLYCDVVAKEETINTEVVGG